MPTEPMVGTRHDGETDSPRRAGTIVVASDGLDSSAGALAAGQAIARQLGCGLEIVSVLEPAQLVGRAFHAPPPPLYRGTTRIRDRRERLRALCARVLSTGTPCATRILIGDPPVSIARAAQCHGASLLITGRVPHGRVERTMRRETPLAALRMGAVPVLAMGADAGLPRCIVVAVGTGTAAAQLAPIASALLHEAASVHLVAVMPDAPTLWDVDGCVEEEAGRCEIEHAFAKASASWAVPPQTRVETHVLTGEPLSTIARFTATVRADLLVVGQERRARAHALPRSDLATRLFRTVSCDMLIVPVEAHDDADSRDVTAISLAPHEWPTALRDFTRRNGGRTASLSIEDGGRSPHALIEAWTLSGIGCDPTNGAITLALADRMDPTRHLSHVVERPTVLGIEGTHAGCDQMLIIGHAAGQVVLTLA